MAAHVLSAATFDILVKTKTAPKGRPSEQRLSGLLASGHTDQTQETGTEEPDSCGYWNCASTNGDVIKPNA
jgi:hypothetical protein